MATKAQVIKVLAQQKIAQWEVERTDPYTFSAWLPDGYIWDNGYDRCGLVVQERMDDDTESGFWDGILCIVNAPVVRGG